MSEQYELRSFPLYNQQPERPHIWVVSPNIHERDPRTNVLPKPGSLAVEPILESHPPNACVFVQTKPSYGISVSRPRDTCSPILNDIDSLHCSSKASFSKNFERFTDWRLSFTSGTVKLLGSPGIAGRFPFVLKTAARSFPCTTKRSISPTTAASGYPLPTTGSTIARCPAFCSGS